MIPRQPETAGVYVGQAKVLACQPDGRPEVLILGATCETTIADWAIPFRYEPVPGDLLLVLGQSGRYWVTGLVHCKGRSQLAFLGPTELKAKGTLHLGGDGGIRLDSPEVCLVSSQLECEAEHLVQRVGDFDSEVKATLDERAGACSRIIDGDDDQTAFRHSTVAKHVAKRDGALLRLS